MQQSKATERLKNVRVGDNFAGIENMLRSMKGEIYKLLTNYMYLNIENLNVYMDLTTNGEYVLNVRAESGRLIDFGKTL